MALGLIRAWGDVMTDLRLKRLLILASNAGGNHKRFYSQYVKTGAMGYTGWVIGMAYLTEKGMKKLEELHGEYYKPNF